MIQHTSNLINIAKSIRGRFQSSQLGGLNTPMIRIKFKLPQHCDFGNSDPKFFHAYHYPQLLGKKYSCSLYPGLLYVREHLLQLHSQSDWINHFLLCYHMIGFPHCHSEVLSIYANISIYHRPDHAQCHYQ